LPTQLAALNQVLAFAKANEDKFTEVRTDASGNAVNGALSLPFCAPLPASYGFTVGYLIDAMEAAGVDGVLNLGCPDDSAVIYAYNFTAVVTPMRV
jgi:hypothetical protein